MLVLKWFFFFWDPKKRKKFIFSANNFIICLNVWHAIFIFLQVSRFLFFLKFVSFVIFLYQYKYILRFFLIISFIYFVGKTAVAAAAMMSFAFLSLFYYKNSIMRVTVCASVFLYLFIYVCKCVICFILLLRFKDTLYAVNVENVSFLQANNICKQKTHLRCHHQYKKNILFFCCFLFIHSLSPFPSLDIHSIFHLVIYIKGSLFSSLLNVLPKKKVVLVVGRKQDFLKMCCNSARLKTPNIGNNSNNNEDYYKNIHTNQQPTYTNTNKRI